MHQDHGKVNKSEFTLHTAESNCRVSKNIRKSSEQLERKELPTKHDHLIDFLPASIDSRRSQNNIFKS